MSSPSNNLPTPSPQSPPASPVTPYIPLSSPTPENQGAQKEDSPKSYKGKRSKVIEISKPEHFQVFPGVFQSSYPSDYGTPRGVELDTRKSTMDLGDFSDDEEIPTENFTPAHHRFSHNRHLSIKKLGQPTYQQYAQEGKSGLLDSDSPEESGREDVNRLSRPLDLDVPPEVVLYSPHPLTARKKRFSFLGGISFNPAQVHRVESFNFNMEERKVYGQTLNMLRRARSMDGDDTDAPLLREPPKKEARNVSSGFMLSRSQQCIKWMLTALIGLVVAGATILVVSCTEYIIETKFHYAEHYIAHGSLFMGWGLVSGLGVLLTLTASFIIVFVEPVATGSGLPEVKAYLNGVITPKLLTIKVGVVKTLCLIMAVSSGLYVGPEGPLVHIGSVIGASVFRVWSTMEAIPIKLRSFLSTDRVALEAVSAGAASGIAAAFSAPMGGVLWAYEEASSFWNVSLNLQCAVAAIFASSGIQIWKSSNFKLDPEGYLGFPHGEIPDYSFIEPFIFGILGIIGGLLGAVFNSISMGVNKRRGQMYAKAKGSAPYLKIFEACCFVFFSTSLVMLAPLLFPCVPEPENLSEEVELVQFTCEEGEYNELATLMYKSFHHMMYLLFMDTEVRVFGYASLFAGLLISYFLIVTTAGIAVPSGLFVPSLVIGSFFGRIAGEVSVDILGNGVGRHPGIYALIGATAMMAGFSRMTVSITVILVEISNDWHNMLALGGVVVIAKSVADYFNEALYELQMASKKLLYLDSTIPLAMHGILVKDIVTTNVTTINSVETVGRLLHLMKTTTYNGFPVIGHNGKLCGLVLRSHILVLLQKRAFQPRQELSNGVTVMLNPRIMYDALDNDQIKVEQIELAEADMELCVDIRCYMDSTPYVIPETATLDRAYGVFRLMGLRHMVVVDRFNKVSGLVTRATLYHVLHKLHHDSEVELHNFTKEMIVNCFRRMCCQSVPQSDYHNPHTFESE